MKRSWLVVLCGVGLAAIVFAQESRYRQKFNAAVLSLPDTLECKAGGSHLFAGKIDLRWDEPELLKIPLWSGEKQEKGERLICDVEVFDENGKKLEQWFFISSPPIPTGQTTLRSGEHREFDFFTWNGFVKFPKAGAYYAVATFPWAQAGDSTIAFVTNKCWFKVVEPPVNKDSGL